MSGGNGNGRFEKYHRRVSKAAGCGEKALLAYAPDFLDSLACRMATPGDWAERVFAWLVYRASGNQSEAAIHIYAVKGETAIETELRQRDCALELAWLEAGHPREWLDAPLAMFRQEAVLRGVSPIDKHYISDGVTENRERGTMADGTGHRLVLVPSPKVAYSSEIHRRKGEDPPPPPRPHQQFEQWAKVVYSSEYQKREVARSTVKAVNKFLLSAYKQWRKSPAPGPESPPSLEALEALETSSSSYSSSLSSGAATAVAKAEDEEEPSASHSPGAATAVARAKQEEPATFETLKALYPQHRFDAGKSKPLFQAMPPQERALVIERLRFYLNCDRWQDAQGKWVPLCSNWLKSYAAEPPPLIRPHNAEDEKLRQQAERMKRTAAVARFLKEGEGS
jgi:hypothetical protein